MEMQKIISIVYNFIVLCGSKQIKSLNQKHELNEKKLSFIPCVFLIDKMTFFILTKNYYENEEEEEEDGDDSKEKN